MKSNWKRIERFCRERGVYRDSEQCRNRWNWLNVIYSRIHSWEEREQSCFWSMKVDEKRANGFGRFKMNRYMYDLINELKNGNINHENIKSIFKDSGDENSKKISDTVDDPKEMQLGHNTRIESEAEQISIGLCFKNKLENRNGDYENAQSLLAEDRDECFSGFSSDTAALKAVVHIDSTKDANTPNVYQASSEVEAWDKLISENVIVMAEKSSDTSETFTGKALGDGHSVLSEERKEIDIIPDYYNTVQNCEFSSVGQKCGKGELHGQGSQICEVAFQSKNSSTSIMQIEHSQSLNDCNESLNVSVKGTNMQVKLVDEMDQITESRINIKEQLSGEDDGTRLEMSTAEFTDHFNEARVLKAGGSIEGRDVVASDSRKLDDDIVMYVPVAIGNTLKSISQAFKKYFKF
ncbi:hypothetical protein KP509_21G061500 [Ceratopteris richardii]|nr:hypothetical protein KP509_21G061500 [Ceratopteris richardii]